MTKVEKWEKDLVHAIFAGNIDPVRDSVARNTRLVDHRIGGETLLHYAIKAKVDAIACFLVESGSDVNARIHSGDDITDETSLENAIWNANFGLTKYLLEHGADPQIGRPVISAITGNSEFALKIIQLLEEHGADLHKVFPFGEEYRPINALSMAKTYGKADVVEYLLAHGARMPDQYSPAEVAAYFGAPMPGEPLPSPTPNRASAAAQETIAYFREHFGAVDPLSLIEIVPSEPQITVHFIPADDSRKLITLFTTGLANVAMNMPADQPKAADYRHAELFLQLPADWKYRDYADPRFGWPIHWLRTIAQYPAAENEWLGGPVTIYDAGEPLGPGLAFDSWLLMAERKYQARDGRTIQLYRLTPLYPEERELEEREGIGALLRAFDVHGTPFVIDLKRKNAAL